MKPLNVIRFIPLFLVFFTTALQASELRIQPKTLQAALQASKAMTIIDVRPLEDYKKNHLPNALNLPVDGTYQNKQNGGALIKPADMQPLLRKMGISADSKVVVYDEGQLVDAARVFWALEVYGLSNVQVLNQGYKGWKTLGLPLTQDVPNVTPSNYVVQINNQRLASKFQTQLATLNPNQVIIDARSTEAYIGEVSSAKRFGHIPSAINIPASHNIEKSEGLSNLQPVDLLKEVYKTIPKQKRIITYCTIGRISAANYLALRELGYNVANYDGAWREWANDFNLPVTKGNE